MTNNTLIKCNIPNEADMEKFKEMLDADSFISTIAPVEYCTSCLVCGETVMVSFLGGGPTICDGCKKAIMFVKEHFRYDED